MTASFLWWSLPFLLSPYEHCFHCTLPRSASLTIEQESMLNFSLVGWCHASQCLKHFLFMSWFLVVSPITLFWPVVVVDTFSDLKQDENVTFFKKKFSLMLFRLILRVNSHAFFFRWAAYIVVAMQGTLLVSALRHYLAPQKKKSV